jgi:tRNA A37 methylthiotransferase MiaB
LSFEEAGLVVTNTCAIRENAVTKVLNDFQSVREKIILQHQNQFENYQNIVQCL